MLGMFANKKLFDDWREYALKRFNNAHAKPNDK